MIRVSSVAVRDLVAIELRPCGQVEGISKGMRATAQHLVLGSQDWMPGTKCEAQGSALPGDRFEVQGNRPRGQRGSELGTTPVDPKPTYAPLENGHSNRSRRRTKLTSAVTAAILSDRVIIQ
jgi:hypothetical protein